MAGQKNEGGEKKKEINVFLNVTKRPKTHFLKDKLIKMMEMHYIRLC